MSKKGVLTWLFISFVIPFFIITNVYATTIETVDSDGDVGEYTSLALDSSGNSHISYWDGTNGDLKYVTNNTGSWTTTTIDSSGNVGQYTSIALDSSDKVHISYYDSTNGDLKYATNVSGSLETTTVDSSGDVGQYSSIALDSRGNAHISYYYASYGRLKYATNATGSWVTTVVDSITNYLVDSIEHVGQYTSIAVDKADNSHISYYTYYYNGYIEEYFMMYATNATGSWVTTTVDSSGDIGQYSSIALDSSGKVHIGYYDATNNSLKYAKNTTGSWKTTEVDSGGMYTSIVLDSSDNVYISFYDNANGDLKYATDASGTWETITVDNNGNVGQYTSIKIDSAERIKGEFQRKLFEAEAETARRILEASDTVHISYYDYTNSNLKYASNITQSTPTTCEDATAIEASPTTLTLQKKEGDTVTVTVTGENSCPVKGVMVKSKVDQDGRDIIRVNPSSQKTDANGEAVFTITAKNKTGSTEVTFKAKKVNLETSIEVDVVNSSNDISGASHESPTPTPTETPVITDTPTTTPTEIPTSTDTPSPTPTETPISTDTPAPTETPVSTVTPTPTSTATPCEDAEAIEASPTELTLQKKDSDTVTITVTGENGCPVEEVMVKSTIDKDGRDLIRVNPASQKTNANGEAVFIVTAKNKTGSTVVTFKVKKTHLATRVAVEVIK